MICKFSDKILPSMETLTTSCAKSSSSYSSLNMFIFRYDGKVYAGSVSESTVLIPCILLNDLNINNFQNYITTNTIQINQMKKLIPNTFHILYCCVLILTACSENKPSENDQRLGVELNKPKPKKRGRKPKANG